MNPLIIVHGELDKRNKLNRYPVVESIWQEQVLATFKMIEFIAIE